MTLNLTTQHRGNRHPDRPLRFLRRSAPAMHTPVWILLVPRVRVAHSAKNATTTLMDAPYRLHVYLTLNITGPGLHEAPNRLTGEDSEVGGSDRTPKRPLQESLTRRRKRSLLVS